jgi:hypothetical protein
VLTQCLESTGYIHAASLRWALFKEDRLKFNTNLRLFTSSRTSGPNRWYINIISAVLHILSYAATSLIFLHNNNSIDPNTHVSPVDPYTYVNPVAIFALGLGLLGQLAIAIWCLRSAALSIPTWRSNSLNTTLASLHSHLQHRSGRCMLSVDQGNLSSEPSLPRSRQSCLLKVTPSVRRIFIFLWSLAGLAIIFATTFALVNKSGSNGVLDWPGTNIPGTNIPLPSIPVISASVTHIPVISPPVIIPPTRSIPIISPSVISPSIISPSVISPSVISTPGTIIRRTSAPSLSVPSTWHSIFYWNNEGSNDINFGPTNPPKELILGLLFFFAIQSLQATGLHCTEVLVNMWRDEFAWRAAYIQDHKYSRGTRLQSTTISSAIFSGPYMFLFVMKALLHWLLGQSLSPSVNIAEINNPDSFEPNLAELSNLKLVQLAFDIVDLRLIIYALLAIMFGLFATVLAFWKPTGPQPVTWGHLQTLADLIDDWTVNLDGRLWWGDKGLNFDGVQHAGTSSKKDDLGKIIMTHLYSG